jgi:uncharacterized protein YjiS (DUF1127 family)
MTKNASLAGGPRTRSRTRRSNRPLKAWERAVVYAIATVMLWRERVRQRRALARLNEVQLRDIGITRGQAQFEANKPFWRR